MSKNKQIVHPACLIVLLLCITVYGQSEKKYEVSTIVFYNVENLFDTIDDPSTRDEARTPAGRYRWTGKRYLFKVNRIAEVIQKTGGLKIPAPADIVGLCEVENLGVLEDLIRHPLLSPYDYGIVHFNSPDERGIDVALLYRKSKFIPSSFKSHRLVLYDPFPFPKHSRDQLVVAGILNAEEVYFIVVHWPSRSGGEELSKPFRKAAAQLTCRILDSIKRETYDPRIVLMGDFNDNPPDESIQSVLLCGTKTVKETDLGLYNPMDKLYKKGVGSLAYRDRWSLFDQFLLTNNFLDRGNGSYSFWNAGVYSPAVLLSRRGRFKGYPFRTYAAGVYQGGFSDHLPIYLHLIREISDTGK